MPIIKIKRIRPNGKFPAQALKGDAGFDCWIAKMETVDEKGHKLNEVSTDTYELKPLERVICCLGFAVAIPDGYFADLRPRSGLSVWNGLSICNTPATIDCGFRGEVKATVVNLSNTPCTLHIGDKICQFLIRKMEDTVLEETTDLPTSERGTGGFGSTGKK